MVNDIVELAKQIKLVITDVDGVLTNGQLFYAANGESMKAFHVKDGLGIKLLAKAGIKTAIITGRTSDILTSRMNELDVEFVYQNQSDKMIAFEALMKNLHLQAKEIAYIGDDLPDLPLIKKAGLGVTVADGAEILFDEADWVTHQKGGMGALRELADLILHAQSVPVLQWFQ